MELLILGFLILLNGFFALSEIALVSSKKVKLEHFQQKGSYGARMALRLMKDSKNFLSAIQVGITLIGIVTGVLGGMNIADDIALFFKTVEFTRRYADQIALSVTILLITYISIVLGELVPKTVALSNPEKIAIRVAPAIFYFSNIFYPFVVLLSSSTSLVNKLLGIKKNTEGITEAELRQIIKLASNEGVIEEEQNKIHEKVFYFSDKKARHIMTHRTDVEWIDVTKPVEEIKEILLKKYHSKLLCCEKNVENFIGIVSLNKCLRALNQSNTIDIKSLMVQPVIIPENTEAQNVLNLFKQNQPHFCVVVNEYGGLEGIITPYDIMENIIGDIPEEGEMLEPDYFVRDDNSVLVNGDASVEVLGEIIEDFTIDYEQIDYSTVAGFVFDKLNKIPQTGDKIIYQNYIIEIVDLDGVRIDKILISKE